MLLYNLEYYYLINFLLQLFHLHFFFVNSLNILILFPVKSTPNLRNKNFFPINIKKILILKNNFKNYKYNNFQNHENFF